tara:strand:+ start:24873 stop:25457 length:585 start_codon:yes stop_codon:yes gene_type:complete
MKFFQQSEYQNKFTSLKMGRITKMRLDSYSFRAQEWIRKNAVAIAHRTIGEEFLRLCDARGMTQRYSQSLHIETATSLDGLKLKIYVDYKDRDGKNIPLDLFFEHGTKDHWIEPKEKKALHWIDTGGSAAKAIYSQGDNLTDGVSRFSTGHYVSGIKARNIMTDTKKIGYPKFKKELMRQLRDYMEKTATAIGV